MATVPQSHADPFSVRNSNLATAQLAEAARAMLVALENVWAELKPNYVSAMADDRDRSSLDEACDSIRAAIAQAKAAGI